MYKRDKVVTDVEPYEAFDDFVDWIDENFKRKDGDYVRLIAHNALDVDAHALVSVPLQGQSPKYVLTLEIIHK